MTVAAPAAARSTGYRSLLSVGLLSVLLLAGRSTRAQVPDTGEPNPDGGETKRSPDAAAVGSDASRRAGGAAVSSDETTLRGPAAVSSHRTPTAAAIAAPDSDSPLPATPLSAEDALGFGDFTPVQSADDPDALGFGEAAPEAGASHPPSAPEPSAWTLQGALRSQNALRPEGPARTRLAKLRLLLDLQLGYGHEFSVLNAPASLRLVAAGRGECDFALLAHHDSYPAPTRELYAWQLLMQDLYMALRWDALELSFGKQIVPFGQGEILSSLDVVNPRDLREPVLTDPGDLRLAVLMSRLGLSLGSVHAELLVVHEANFGLTAPPLAELSPIRKLLLSSDQLGGSFAGHDVRYAHEPAARWFRLRSAQYHVRVSYSGDGLDLAWQAASVLDPLGVASLPSAKALLSDDIDLPLYHPRYSLFGHAGAYTTGPFVLRWEAAADMQRLTATRRVDTNLLQLGVTRSTQLHGLLGVTWVPATSTSAAFEWQQTYVVNDPSRHRTLSGPYHALLWPLQAPQLALRFAHTFWNERASLNLLALAIGIAPLNAFAARVDLGYRLLETWQITLGYMLYRPSARFGPLYGFDESDRVLLNMRWDFALR